MLIHFVVIVTVILCLNAPTRAAHIQSISTSTADKRLDSVRIYLEAGELRQARIILNHLSKTHSEIRSQPSAVMLQSLIYEKSGDTQKAIDSLKVLETPQTLLRSSVLLEMSGQSLAALTQLKKLPESFPENLNSEWAQLTLACTAISLEQLDTASQALQAPVIKGDPLARRVRDFLEGVVAFKKGRFKDAQELLERMALDKFDGFAPAVLSLKALAAAMRGDDKDTVSLCNHALGALGSGRERTSLLFLRGLAFQHQGQTDLALGDFQAVTQSRDDFLSPRAMLFTAQTLWMERKLVALTGEFQKNLTAFRQSFKPAAFSPEILECDFLIGEAHFALRQYAAAERIYGNFLTHAASTRLVVPAVSGHVSSLSAQKKFDEAAQALDQMMVRFGDDRALLKFGYLAKAQLAWNRSRFGEAEVAYQRFAEMFEDDAKAPEALYYAGLSLEKEGKVPEALKTWEQMRLKFPSSPYAFRGLVREAHAAEKSGDASTAQRTYMLLAASGESSAAEGAHFQLAKAELAAQRYPEAIKRFDDFLKRFPTSNHRLEVYSLLREAYARVADTEPECLISLADEYSASKHAGEAWFRRGLQAFDQQKFDEAGTYFQKVLSGYPSAPSALEAMFYAAEADYQAGRFKESLAPFAQFVRGAQDHSLTLLAQFHRARAMRKCGYNQDAALIFDEIAKRAPQSIYGVEALRNKSEIAGEVH